MQSSLIDAAHIGISRSTEDGRFLDANTAFAQMLGYASAAEVRSRDITTEIYYRPRDREPILARLRATHSLRDVDVQLKRADGRPVWVRANAEAHVDRRGAIESIDSIIIPIDHEKAMEAEHERLLERLRLVREATHDAMWDRDLRTNTTWCNDAAIETFGDSEALARPDWWETHLHPDDRDRVLAHAASVMASDATRWTQQYRMRKGDGTYMHVLDRVSIVRENGVPVRIVGSLVDLTLRVEAESRYSLLFDSAEEIIFVIGFDATILALNPAFERMSGWRRDQWIGRSLFGILHPDDRARARTNVALASAGRSAPREVRVLRADGSYGIVHTWATMSNDVIFGFARDVTEVRNLKRQVEQAARIESLGRVAANVSHEFRNVLMAIAPYIEVLTRLHADDRSTQLLRRIRYAVDRGNTLVEEILTFGQPREPVREAISLGEWLREFTADVTPTLPESIVLVAIPVVPELVLDADPTQLYQLFLNLVLNAREAMPLGGVITIEASEEQGNGDRCVHIEVRDDGNGIPRAHLPHIFEPLYTTRSRGTGLGLPLVQQIVSRHGGWVDVESEPGQGTSIHIRLPMSNG
ncbi:MAG TPA: PAS domain S-box protein [Thermoanaerobaculia bacterium]|nr:PAS domain S-box protein [Thermoanaerobaculia bacterium]